MCEQCEAKTDLYLGPNDESVLPGWYLTKATKDGNFVKKDDWCLVQCNNPDYWWQITPIEDPDFGLTDEEMYKLDKHTYEDRYGAFDKAVENLEEALNGTTANMQSIDKDSRHCLPRFESAGLLWEAARKVGYDPEVHGYRFAFWLCHHIATFLKTAKIEKHE